MAQPIAGTFGGNTYVCGADRTFACYLITPGNAPALKATSKASVHNRQPGLVVGRYLYIMDDLSPEIFDGSILTAFPAPKNYVGMGASMAADGTVGFYVFGGSSQPSGILQYTISTKNWLLFGSMPSPNYMFGSLFLSKTPAGITTILVGGNVLTVSPANTGYLFDAVAPSNVGVLSTPISSDSSNVNLYGATFFQISGRIFAIGGGYDGPAALVREYDATNKKWLAPVAIPSTRSMSAATTIALDTRGAKFVGCTGLAPR